MNRKLNVKLLLCLFFGTVAFLVTVYFVHDYQVGRNAAGLLKRADQAQKAGDLFDAIKFRKRYLYYRRDDFEQLSKLALDMKRLTETETGLSQRDFAETYSAIETALRELNDAGQPERYQALEEELRRAAVDFTMGYGLLPAAIDHLQRLLQQDGDNPDPELQIKLARCRIANGELDEGIRILSQMIGYDVATRTFSPPARKIDQAQQINAYYLLAVIYSTKIRDTETAVKMLARMVETHPDSYDAYLKRCLYWKARGDLYKDKARADIEKALTLGPDEADVLGTAAEVALNDDELDKAKSILDRAVKLHHDDARFYRLLATWAAKNQDYDQSRKYVEEGLKAVPGNIDLVWYRANLELEIGQVDEAKKSLDQLKKIDAPATYVDVMEAQISMAENQWLTASELLERVRPEVSQRYPLLLSMVDRGLARCYEMLGQSDKMLSAYRNLVQAMPDDQASQWGLIKALLLAGQVKTAMQTYRQLEGEINRRGEKIDSRFLPTLLQLKIAVQQLLPEDQRDWTEANQLMVRIQKDPSIADVDKIKYAADLLRNRGDKEAADRVLQQAREKHGDDLSFRLAEVDRVYQQKGFEAAGQLLDSLTKEFGDKLAIRTARARLVAQRGGADMNQRLLKLEENVDSFSPREKASLWWTLASYHYLVQDYENARRLFQQVAKLRPDDVRVRLTLFELAKEMNDDAQVTAQLADLEKLVGSGGAEYQAAEASRIIWQIRQDKIGKKELSRARSLVAQARQTRPQWDKLQRLEADIYLLEGDPDAAIEVLKRAIEGGQSQPLVRSQLVELLFSQKRYDEARKVVASLPASQRSARVQQIAKVLEGGSGASLDELATHLSSTNPDDHLSDARMLVAAQRWDEAEQALRRAVRFGPTRTNTWLALVGFLTSRGRLDQAEDVVHQAQLQLPEYQVPLLAGQCYEMIPGDAEQALHFFTRAIQINPRDPLALQALASFHLRARRVQNAYQRRKHTDQARQYLQRLLDLAQQNADTMASQAAWARREMARLVAASGRYPDYLEALRLIEKNADSDGNLGSEDVLQWVSLAAARRDATSRQRAIEQLEKAKSHRPLTDGESLVLAELYVKTNQKWDQCQAIMEEMIANKPDDANLVALWIDWLLKRHQTEQAASLLPKLDAETAQAKSLKARLLVQQGKPNDAAKALRSLLPDTLPTEPAKTKILLDVAQLTEQLAADAPVLYGPAEKLYREFAKRNPAAKLALAAFLGRRGGQERVQQAMQLCGEAIKDQPLQAVVQTAMTILRDHPRLAPKESKYWQQLRTWIGMFRQRFPNAVMPILQQASMEEALGNLPAAEDLYRQLLERTEITDFDRAVVSNNLAFLLALQGKGNEAYSLVDQALGKLGPIDDVLDTRAVAYIAQQQPQKARKDLQTVISGGSKSPDVFFHLAQAENMLGVPDDARESLQRAIELGLSVEQVKPVERPLLRQLAQQLGVDLSQKAASSATSPT